MKRWQRRVIGLVLQLLLIAAAMVFTYYGVIWAIGQFVKAGFPGS
jgi:TRAP-type C4-dicarboxylate transport system permease small subunit